MNIGTLTEAIGALEPRLIERYFEIEAELISAQAKRIAWRKVITVIAACLAVAALVSCAIYIPKLYADRANRADTEEVNLWYLDEYASRSSKKVEITGGMEELFALWKEANNVGDDVRWIHSEVVESLYDFDKYGSFGGHMPGDTETTIYVTISDDIDDYQYPELLIKMLERTIDQYYNCDYCVLNIVEAPEE